jgi:hypothetical protein
MEKPCLCKNAYLFPSGHTYCKIKQCETNRETMYPCKDHDPSKRFTLVKVSDIQNPDFTFFTELTEDKPIKNGMEVKKLKPEKKKTKEKPSQQTLF